MTLDERTTIAEEATRLEAAGADWSVKHVSAVLGLSRATIYNTAWLLRISRRVGKRGRRWTPAEVRRAQSIASATTRTTVLRTAS